ncbi:hypothetical protein BG015_010018 [Linnemannia schmuckeri]|uniref:Uncharacterized protein n=1 Tax=Linnemannia schmuckeri TaxID=64567 RepID=A0A9P5RV36_9FUNG|nr:hypothetical protein BG015_010018 [Linnemannia schmuckeri]
MTLIPYMRLCKRVRSTLLAALDSKDFNNDSTTKCCGKVRADFYDPEPLYMTCANMSDGQLGAFTKCCPIIVHVDLKKHNKGYKGKNDKRNISKRN